MFINYVEILGVLGNFENDIFDPRDEMIRGDLGIQVIFECDICEPHRDEVIFWQLYGDFGVLVIFENNICDPSDEVIVYE